MSTHSLPPAREAEQHWHIALRVSHVLRLSHLGGNGLRDGSLRREGGHREPCSFLGT